MIIIWALLLFVVLFLMRIATDLAFIEKHIKKFVDMYGKDK